MRCSAGFIGLSLLAASRLWASSGLPVVFHAVSARQWVARGANVESAIDPAGMTFRDGAHLLRLDFPGSAAGAALSPCGSDAGVVSYFRGRDESAWLRGVPAYECAWVLGLYPGVDLRVGSTGGRIKSEFVVQPGASPDIIRLRYSPAARLAIEPDGALRVETSGGDWREAPPLLFQRHGGRTVRVEGRYVLRPGGEAAFQVGDYDRALPLVIDPVVTFSTLLGGNGISAATGTAVDSSGFVYVAGYTDAPDLPTQSPASPRSGGVDAFVAKLEPATGRLVYATYIGGTGDDRASAIAVDSMGSAYIAGATSSGNFPVAIPAQATISGSRDAFLVKLAPDGTALAFSTYYGGTQADTANALALTSTGVWIGGDTSSATLPGVSGWQTANRGMQDGFLAKFSPSGVRQAATFIGGAGDDTVRAVSVDASGNVYAAGATGSANLGVPAGAAQSSLRGSQDGFVMKLDPPAATLLAGTYLGGTLGDAANVEMVLALAVDGSQNVFAGGVTPSPDFPAPAAWAGTLSGLQDGFLVRLNSTLSSQSWGTFVGGAGKEAVTCLSLDGQGGLLAAGSTSSSNFPLQSPLQAASGGGYDAFLLRISQSGTAVSFSTYLGGSGAEGAAALALSPGGSVILAGQSSSPDFTQKNPAQPAAGSVLRMFVSRVAMGTLPSIQGLLPNAGSGSAQAFELSVTHPGGAAQIGVMEFTIATSLNKLPACRVRYSPASGLLALADNAAQTWTPVRPGTADSASNSQCTLSGAASAAAAIAGGWKFTAALTFASGFAGQKQLWANAAGVSGEETGFAPAGAWTVFAPANQAPSAQSVSPPSGSGPGGIFTLTLSDLNGGADISAGRLLFNTQAVDAAGCSLRADRSVNRVLLADDSGAVWAAGIPGDPGYLENSQCRLRLAGTSIAVAGNSLVFVADVTFKSAFSGARTIYGAATDSQGAQSGWTTLGAWTVSIPTANQPPSAVSVAPSAGSGAAQVFTFTFTDVNGAADIAVLRVLINAQQSAAGGCYFAWDRTTGVIWLADDAGAAWATSARAGTADVAQNSQCAFRAAGSSIATSGATLTLAVDLAFTPAFNGQRLIFANATDAAGLTSPSPQLGSFTVSAGAGQPLGPVSVAPSAGSGAAQIFTFAFADPKGAADLAWVRILINAQQSAVAGCYLAVDRAAGLIYLAGDAGSTWSAPARIGTADTAQNSQCTVRGATSSLTLAGTTATLVVDLTFAAAFSGQKSIWANATDSAYVTSGSPLLGTFNVTAGGQQPLGPVSVAPANGSGSAQLFTFSYADPKGAADLVWLRVLISAQQAAAAGCYLAVDRAAGLIYLADDAGAVWSAPARLGTADTAQNSQCSVRASASGITLSGTTASLVLDLTFTPAFAGPKSIWANATDLAGTTSPSPLLGSFTVSTGVANLPPSADSVSPAGASGNRQVFTLTFSDPNGAQDIATPRVLIHSQQRADGGCYVLLNRAAATLYLADDAGVNWAPVRLGAAESAQNSQCIVWGLTSSATATGNQVLLLLDLSLKTAFSGTRSIWANATDGGGLTSPSPLLGTYTVLP
ncbi:MAG: SBBP repeat-containing protein [Candidatus Solibacter usitatus]|nr:SBBP repeat-containing protein [Candidatus Solibacter usitatus]